MILKISVISTTIFTLTVNLLSVLLPINNLTPQQITDLFFVFFRPANYVFGIWFIIYILLIGYSIKQFDLDYPHSNKIRFLVIVINLLNSFWVIAWHYLRFDLGILLMFLILISLIITYKTMVRISFRNKLSSLLLKNFFSIYLGWICVATIANVSIYLVTINWNRLSLNSLYWAIIMIVISTVIGILFLSKYRDFYFTLVILWSLIGIAYQFQNFQNLFVPTVVCILLLSFYTLHKVFVYSVVSK